MEWIVNGVRIGGRERNLIATEGKFSELLISGKLVVKPEPHEGYLYRPSLLVRLRRQLNLITNGVAS